MASPEKRPLDMRLIDPDLPDDPGSKLNRVVRETFDRWQAGRETRAAQVLFADSYHSPGSEPIPGQRDEDGNPARRAIPEKQAVQRLRGYQEEAHRSGRSGRAD